MTMSSLECRFCQRVFSKGEHLRRHERGHTGSKPFACKHCRRSFSRQDSLQRHERLHTRTPAAFQQSPSPPLTERATSDPVDSEQSVSAAGRNQLNQGSALSHSDVQGPTPLSSELDFELIWPDSEDLFQTLISSDSYSPWQLPLGAPLPETYAGSSASLGTVTTFDDKAPSIGTIPTGGNRKALHDVSQMVSSSSSSLTSAIESASITSIFLDECLHMFFVRFIPTFPVLHRATFVFKDCAHPLLLNAIAIGSLYMGPKDAVHKGELLWRLAHAAVTTSWQSLITHRGLYDTSNGIQLVLTALLGSVYGTLSKDRAIRTSSQAFHAMAFFWARHCGMFDDDPYDMAKLSDETALPAEKDRQWRLWVAKEMQRRALLAHYLVDGLLSQMSGNPTIERHVANRLPLPGCDAAFNAGTADEWVKQMRVQQPEHIVFCDIYCNLFAPVGNQKWFDQKYSTFTLRVILEGLQSLISDHDHDQNVLGVPSKTDISNALAQLYDYINNYALISTIDRLELLLRWHSICLEAIMPSSMLCMEVCKGYDIDQHLWPNDRISRFKPDVVNWASSASGRQAILHAVAIQDITEELPRGRAHAIHMPSSMFAAATVYSVYALAGHTTVKFPSVVEWQEALHGNNDSCDCLSNLCSLRSDTLRYLCGHLTRNHGTSLTTRNLLYEFNSMQKLFGCLKTQWGISSDMETVVDKWISSCH